MVVREAVMAYTIHHFMVKLGWVRHKFNCFFSLLPSRWRIMHDYGSGTNVHVKLTRWRFFIVVSTTRLPTENGKWGRQAERTRRKKKMRNFTPWTYKLVRLHLAIKTYSNFFVLLQPSAIVHSSSGAITKLSAQHNLIEIIKCKCCPEWTRIKREQQYATTATTTKIRWNEKKHTFKWSLLAGMSHSS